MTAVTLDQAERIIDAIIEHGAALNCRPLSVIVVVYIVLTVIAGAQLRRRLSQKSHLFSTTLDELRKDEERLHL